MASHHGCLKDQPGGHDAPEAAATPDQDPPGQAEGGQAPPDGSLDACGRERRLVTRTRERYAEIRGRLDAGESLSAISRVTGLGRKTVQRFARAGRIDELLVMATSGESKLDEFKPYLHQRWNEGVTDAAALHAGLRERGWAGSMQTVRRYVRPFRQALTAPGPAPAVPETRQITRWLLTRPDRLQRTSKPSSRPSAPAARTSTRSPGTQGDSKIAYGSVPVTVCNRQAGRAAPGRSHA